MKEFIKKINKYIILMIISSLFSMLWMYFSKFIFDHGSDILIDHMPTIVDFSIKIITIVFLIIDFKKENLKYAALACVAAFFYPMLGVLVFSLLLIENNRLKANL